jgi:hypothetical protein
MKDKEQNLDSEPDELLDGEYMKDEPINNEDDDEDDGDSGKKDGKGGTGGRKINPDALRALIEEEYSDEAWLDKIKLIAIGPFSSIIPGASAFDAESDLKKKILMSKVGILTKQIEPSDIADPDLIKKLEARLDIRKEDLKALIGQLNPMAAKISAATTILGASALALMATQKIGEDRKPNEKQETLKSELVERKTGQNFKSDIEVEEVAKVKHGQFDTSLDTSIKTSDEVFDSKLLDMLDNKEDRESFAAQLDNDSVPPKRIDKPTGNLSLKDNFTQAVNTRGQEVQSVQLKQEVRFKIHEPQDLLRPNPDKFTF